MSGYSVRIAPRAERDFDRIIAWLAERSVSGAKKLEAAFGEAARRLVENPFLYPLATADELRRLGVRQVYFKTRHGRPYRASWLNQQFEFSTFADLDNGTSTSLFLRRKNRIKSTPAIDPTSQLQRKVPHVEDHHPHPPHGS